MRWSVSRGAPCGRRQWQVLTRRERAAAGRGAYRDPRLCRAGWQVPEEWRQLSCHSTSNSRNSVVICGPQAEEGSVLGDASATSPILAIISMCIHDRAQHDPAFVRPIIAGSAVHRGQLVPHQHIADTPVMVINE